MTESERHLLLAIADVLVLFASRLPNIGGTTNDVVWKLEQMAARLRDE